MAQLIPTNLFTQQLYLLLEEVFEKTHGIILDKGTSLFDTLNSVTAREASLRIVADGTTIASHTEHIRFYLEVLDQYMRGIVLPSVDWKGSWYLATVDEPEWEALKKRTRDQYERAMAQMKSFEDWSDEKQLGGAMGIVTHTAYHLGAIRQILRVVKK